MILRYYSLHASFPSSVPELFSLARSLLLLSHSPSPTSVCPSVSLTHSPPSDSASASASHCLCLRLRLRLPPSLSPCLPRAFSTISLPALGLEHPLIAPRTPTPKMIPIRLRTIPGGGIPGGWGWWVVLVRGVHDETEG
eukprot:761782-Hanusia_phi.AAC.7